MKVETIAEREDLVIRRMILAPGEPMYWHTDLCHRFSVVVQGSRLSLEYQDNGEIVEFEVHPGMADWDQPECRVHRAINSGPGPYEEVVTFYRDSAGVEPQPRPPA